MPGSKVQGEFFKLLPLIKNYERKSSKEYISSEYMLSSKEDLKTESWLWLVNEKGSSLYCMPGPRWVSPPPTTL